MARKFTKAESCDLSVLRLPVLCLVKIDGVNGGQLLKSTFTARTLKEFKNAQVGDLFSHPAFYGFNGELAVGSLTDGATCRRTTGVVNSYSWNAGGEIPILYPFEYITEETEHLGYVQRYNRLEEEISALPPELSRYIRPIPEVKLCRTLDEVLDFHSMVIAAGYEGTILRDPQGRYKDGRSTLKEGLFLRLKDQETSEAVVLRVIEAAENLNPAQINEMGNTFRTSHKENKIGKGMAGSFECLWRGEIITVAAGEYDHEDRVKLWDDRHNTGWTLHFRYMPYGSKDKPRFPRAVPKSAFNAVCKREDAE